MKEYRHAHKVVTPEVVSEPAEETAPTADAVEVESTPVAK
jgi:hypothetical protein